MTDKEKLEAIKTELIRIKEVRGIYPDIMNDILAFIDSLPSEEEPVNENLNDASEKYNEAMSWCFEAPRYPHKAAFIAGAQWNEQQILKNAKNGIGSNDNYIQFDDGTWIDLDPSMKLNPAFDVKEGERIKLIIIKEE